MSCPFAPSATGPAPHRLGASMAEPGTSQLPGSELAVLPQPPEHLFGLLGNLPDIDPSNLTMSMWKLAELYGPIFKLRLRRDFVVVCDQKHINEVCDETRFEKLVNPSQQEIRALLGDGLFTAHQPEKNWAIAHRILVPSFGPMSIRKMFPEMLDIASQMLLKWDRQGKDHAIDVADDFTRLAFDTIGICAFSYRFNEFYSDKPHPFAEQMSQVLLESGRRGNRTALENSLHRWSEQTRQENVKKMHAVCDEIVANRRKNPQPDNKDLLNVMLTTADPETGEKLSDESIRFNLCTFLVAGHETTSGTLSFCMYHLLKNPEKLLKAQQQVDEVVGDGVLKLEHLTKMTYIDAVIKETLRLTSPISSFIVHPKEDTKLDGKYPVTKDTFVQALIRPMQHDPKLWGEDVEEFKPERMLEGRFEAMPANSWKPFGNGMRACIGRSFAEQEMLMNVTLILQRFQLEFDDPSYELKYKSTLTIKPLNLRIKVTRRPGKSLMTGLPGGGPAEPTPQSTKNTRLADDKSSEEVKQFPLSVFFGGNSGTCKAFAEDIETKAANHGMKATVGSLDSATEHLPTDRPVIIVTASYEGKPPDNARKFVKWLELGAEDQRLKGVNYTVFGVGNSDWASTFHKIPKLVDQIMHQMGAHRFVEPGFTNVKGDLVGPWENWSDKLWESLHQFSGSTETSKDAGLEVTVKPSPRKAALGSEEIRTGTILANYELANADIGPAKKHMVVRLPEGARYESGDYLVVLPRNRPDTVQRVLQRFDLSDDDLLTVANSSKKFLPIEPKPAFEFFSASVELSTPVTRRQIATISTFAPEDLKSAIANLGSDDTTYSALLEKRYTILDVLDEYPAISLPLSIYLDMLAPLSMRQYSISSSPLAHAPEDDHSLTTCTLTYDVLTAPAWSTHGLFYGVASSYLASRRPGDRIDCFVRPTAVGFRLPADPATPVIMMAAGTGIAPMIAFCQERAAKIEAGQTLGPAALFFGCRDTEKDFLYKDQLKEWQAKGIVQVFTAFSRANTERGAKYVQDKVWEEKEAVSAMFKDGGKIYICGSAERLAKGVADVCRKIYRENTGASVEETEAWMEKQREARYIADVY